MGIIKKSGNLKKLQAIVRAKNYERQKQRFDERVASFTKRVDESKESTLGLDPKALIQEIAPESIAATEGESSHHETESRFESKKRALSSFLKHAAKKRSKVSKSSPM